jgi:hypothetical protein
VSTPTDDNKKEEIKMLKSYSKNLCYKNSSVLL